MECQVCVRVCDKVVCSDLSNVDVDETFLYVATAAVATATVYGYPRPSHLQPCLVLSAPSLVVILLSNPIGCFADIPRCHQQSRYGHGDYPPSPGAVPLRYGD